MWAEVGAFRGNVVEKIYDDVDDELVNKTKG